MNEIKIHDIKQLTDIPDFSFYIYIILWILAISFLSIIIFLIFQYFKNKKKCNRKNYHSILKNINLNEAKSSAYTITKYARLLAKSDREKKMCNELIEELNKFKYKKNVSTLSDEVKILFGRFMDNVDV